MTDPHLLIMVGVVFCLAGFVKGMVGLGLPTVSLGLLSIIVDLPTAMALLVMPSLATNVWQALVGGQIGALWRRLWLFLLMAVVMVHLGAQLSTLVETQFLHRCLGA
ncbi:MAG: TSUP family transporter, partial [Proteobacteria bacterium]|nr:TSUP family transporter [Pseudomonadota bacterium]